MKAAKLFRRGMTQAMVAKQLGVTKVAVFYWHREWRSTKENGLKKKTSGPKRRLTEAKLRIIEERLGQGPERAGYATNLWTLERVGALIADVAHVHYGQTQVWNILGAMGWSCQKPARRAKERDEEAIAHWIKVEWPSIQKRGAKTA